MRDGGGQAVCKSQGGLGYRDLRCQEGFLNSFYLFIYLFIYLLTYGSSQVRG